MINGIFTRHKQIPFATSSSGTSHLVTLTKKSQVVVEWVLSGITNNQVSVKTGSTSGGDDGRVYLGHSEYITNPNSDESFQSEVMISTPAILASGTPIVCSRSDVNIILHIYELE